MIQDENAEIDAGMVEVDFPPAEPGRTTPSLHLCSPFQQKSLGQDSPSIHLFSKIIWSRFTKVIFFF